MRDQKKLIRTILLALLAVIYTLAVKLIDVKEIGPAGTRVGFSAVNGIFAKLIGYHKFWYILTEVLGVIAVLTAVLFALIGLLQLIQRKNLLKVDRNILMMGCMYIVVILLYIFFEKCIINYRPVLLGKEPEASYPSSHSMIACCIFGMAMIECRKTVTRKAASDLIQKVLAGLLIVTTAGRLLSGVHWFSDILGGVLISAAVVSLYDALSVNQKPGRKKPKKIRSFQDK